MIYIFIKNRLLLLEKIKELSPKKALDVGCGKYTVQAGKINGARVPLPVAFAAHQGPVENDMIKFYAHHKPMEKSK